MGPKYLLRDCVSFDLSSKNACWPPKRTQNYSLVNPLFQSTFLCNFFLPCYFPNHWSQELRRAGFDGLSCEEADSFPRTTRTVLFTRTVLSTQNAPHVNQALRLVCQDLFFLLKRHSSSL